MLFSFGVMLHHVASGCVRSHNVALLGIVLHHVATCENMLPYVGQNNMVPLTGTSSGGKSKGKHSAKGALALKSHKSSHL